MSLCLRERWHFRSGDWWRIAPDTWRRLSCIWSAHLTTRVWEASSKAHFQTSWPHTGMCTQTCARAHAHTWVTVTGHSIWGRGIESYNMCCNFSFINFLISSSESERSLILTCISVYSTACYFVCAVLTFASCCTSDQIYLYCTLNNRHWYLCFLYQLDTTQPDVYLQ